MWEASLQSQLGEDAWWFARSESDSKVWFYQIAVIDSSVYNLNPALHCKVRIHDATLKQGCWDQKEPGGLCASPSSPGTAQMPQLDWMLNFQTA